MAKQDDYVRITLRLPPDLHQRLVDVAGQNSLNAEIVGRLETSLKNVSIDPDEYKHLKAYDPDRLVEEIEKSVDEKINKRITEELKRLGVTGLFDK